MATAKTSTTEAPNACRNCKGAGYFDDVRFAGITHRATPVRWTCRYCSGTGDAPPTTPHVDVEWDRDGDIPAWMLGCLCCMCCTYCGTGDGNDCPTSSIGDSTCPCTCD